MKVKLFNVNIVNRNTHKKVILRHTSRQYMVKTDSKDLALAWDFVQSVRGVKTDSKDLADFMCVLRNPFV